MELDMVDPSSFIGPLAGAAGTASEYYEFWKEYKGEEILIRNHSISRGGKKNNGVRQNTHVIRGTVKDVTSFPPGFLLEDVEEYIEISNLNLQFGMEIEPVGVSEGTAGRQTLREIDEKYVSFNSINQIERAEAADSAIEPFRDEQIDYSGDS